MGHKGIIKCIYFLNDESKYTIKSNSVVFLKVGNKHSFKVDTKLHFRHFDYDQANPAVYKDKSERGAKYAKWAFILSSLYDTAASFKKNEYEYWGDEPNANNTSVNYMGIGTQYKMGANFKISTSHQDVWTGAKYRVEVFNNEPGQGLFFEFITFDKPSIRFAYFDKQDLSPKLNINGVSDGRYYYNQVINLYISTHQLPKLVKEVDSHYHQEIIQDITITLDLLDDKGEVLQKGFIQKEDLAQYLYIDYLGVNSDFKIPFKIPKQWRDDYHKDSNTEKIYSIGITIESAELEEPLEYIIIDEFKGYSKFNKEKTELVEAKKQNFFSVKYTEVTKILAHQKKEISEQIQSIGDVKYNKKEFDPCGYSKIIIKEKGNTKRDPLVIFDEKDKDTENFIDNTQQGFDIVAGDKTKNVVIITVEGLHNGSAYACSGVMLPKGKMHDTWEDVFQMENAYAVKRHQENWVKNSRKTYNDKYLSIKKKKDNIQTQYGKSRFSPHPYTVYDKEEDPTHQEQLKQARIEINNANKQDTDVIRESDKEYTPSITQGLIKEEDYKQAGENGLQLLLNYHYNKTYDARAEKWLGNEVGEFTNNLLDLAWICRYFVYIENIRQTYFVPISTCRYPNQIARINVYPDFEWWINIKYNAENPIWVKEKLNYGYRVFTSRKYQNRDNYNRKVKEVHKTKDRSHTLDIVAGFKYNGEEDSWSIGDGFSFLKTVEFLLYAYEVVKDLLFINYTSTIKTIAVSTGRAKRSERSVNVSGGKLPIESANKVPKIKEQMSARRAQRKSKGLPVKFTLDRPSFSGGVHFKYTNTKDSQYTMDYMGQIKAAASPFTKLEGRLDLLFFAQFIGPIGVIIGRINNFLNKINLFTFGAVEVDYYLDIVATLEFNASIEGTYHQKEGFDGDIKMHAPIKVGLQSGGTIKYSLVLVEGGATLTADAMAKFNVQLTNDKRADKKAGEVYFDGLTATFTLKFERRDKEEGGKTKDKKHQTKLEDQHDNEDKTFEVEILPPDKDPIIFNFF